VAERGAREGAAAAEKPAGRGVTPVTDAGNDGLRPRTLNAAMETAKPFVDDAMQTYDEMIELVCSADVGKN
jgi:hypothetical protein